MQTMADVTSDPAAAETVVGSPARTLPAEPLTITTAPTGACSGVVVVRAAGEIDLASVEALRRELDERLVAVDVGLVLDLTAVTFLPACGLGALVEAADRAETAGVTLRLLDGEGYSLARVIDLAGLAHTLPVADDLEAAVRECTA